jgi:glutathione-specific gamma-glutamylcyclotransferase
MLRATLRDWEDRGRADLWLFAYGSLIWKVDFAVREQRRAAVYGHHRALRMWSRINRGTPEQPGLVFALLSGGSCQGMALRIGAAEVPQVLPQLWEREMPHPVYDPKWLRCRTPQGTVAALAFTLSRRSPSYTGPLSAEQLRTIFTQARGRYGSTLDYARQTHARLQALGIRDPALAELMRLAADL